MGYVLDTGILRKMLDHMPKKGKLFENIWDLIEEGITKGFIVSVDECLNELYLHFSEKHPHYLWLKAHEIYFLNPTDEESKTMKYIYSHNKMRDSIRKKNILENRPVADAFVVAKAKHLGYIVVSTEEYKPNSAQIPNMCQLVNVPWIDYDDFMQQITET